MKLSEIFLTSFLFSACTSTMKPNADSAYYSADDFTTVPKTDAHIHIQTYDSSCIQQARSDNFHLFTINYDDVNEPPPMEEQQEYATHLMKTSPDRIQYATTISIRNFKMEDWMSQTLDYLRNSMKLGAKAVKIYKVIGMSLRDSSGRLVMIDDPVFDPLFTYLENNNIPVVGHLGEPRNCWLPLDKMTIKGDAGYFSSQPEYHMYLHPELPSYEQQINARDNMLAKHPKLVFVGAHLGSLEYDVDSLALRLNRFPNMAVDMAARIDHLQLQARDNREKVRNFIIKYSDRLLYATDKVVETKTDPTAAKKSLHDTWVSDWKFFTSDEKMSSQQFDGNFTGLKLPKDVIDKIYYKNAQKWLGVF
jgi:predicted TIM-barrel fold metal-dependent hydrolase